MELIIKIRRLEILYIIIQKLYLDWGVIMYGQLLMGEMVICMWLMLFMDLV